MTFKRFPKATVIINEDNVVIEKVGYREPLRFSLETIKKCIENYNLAELSYTIRSSLYFSIDEAATIVLWIRSEVTK